MAEQLENILTLDDYNTLVAEGGYEISGITVEVSGDTYTPSLDNLPVDDLSIYDFTGYDVGELQDLTGGTSTIAQYALATYTVSFSSLYDTPEDQIIVRGDYAIAPPVPMAPSYDNGVFYAWYTDNITFQHLFDFQNTPITEDITLYARWIPSSVLFIAEEDDCYVGLARISTKQELWWSYSGETWTVFEENDEIPLPHSGDSVYIRGILSGNNTDTDYTQFYSSGRIQANSNCNALWNYLNPEASLYRYCGYNLFHGCTITTAPQLPSGFLSAYCYAGMFAECTNLETAPELPAMRALENCYSSMFDGCSSLTTAPELPATVLTQYCYDYMFGSCTSLTTAPVLPATTLASYCYHYMFNNCTSLTTAPELPATALAQYCYNGMLSNCTSLTTAPELPATTLVDYCYSGMFSHCNNLNYIKCLATDISAESCTEGWVRNVAPTGTFVKADDITVDEGSGWTSDSVDGIPIGWYVIDDKDNIQYLAITALEDETVVGFSRISTYQTLRASKNIDFSDYETVEDTTFSVTLSSGESVYFRGILSNDIAIDRYTRFNVANSKKFAVSGNIIALWNFDENFDHVKIEEPLKQRCGYRLFQNCTGLVDASELTLGTINTTLREYCYDYMFGSCTSLTTVPELPATTLANACYSGMFNSCTSLTTAPELPATTLADYCYNNMFSHCTSLTTAPELPAATLSRYCYFDMFYNCTSLTTAPELPATTLVEACYSLMFRGCTSLTSAPELPATILTYQCYSSMFNGCTSLNYIKCLATDIIAGNCTGNWVVNVAPTGIFVKADGMEQWQIDSPNGIPIGWTLRNNSDVAPYITFIALQSGSTIGLVQKSSNQLLEYYDIENSEWVEFTPLTTITLSEVGDELYVRGKLNDNNTSTKYTQFNIGNDSRVSVSGCINSLWDYEDLNALLKEYCGYSLFQNCTGLEYSDGLLFPTTPSSIDCYAGMFAECTNLKTTPELLPATELGYGCYSNMFHGCSNIETVPELPATALTIACYNGMFQGCGKITTAPELSAPTLVPVCYQNMFSYCRSLEYIKCLATDISATNCTGNWVKNVASTGTFIKADDMEDWLIDSPNGIPIGWTPSEDFTTVINAINQLSGKKSFLYKFDNSPYVWVLTVNDWSDTTHVLHVFDLNGNELASVSQNSKYHYGVVINNYICMYQGTSNNDVPIDIFQFDGISTITKIQTKTTNNYPGGGGHQFAYIDNSNNIHFCGYANSGRVAMWDYNVQTNYYVRTESSIDAWVSWYNYDGSYFRGLMWSSTSGQLRQVAYVKRTQTTNNYDGSTFYPTLSNYYCAYFLPLFYYDGSYDKLQYEVFAGSNNVAEYFNNVLGLDATEPSNLSLGNISIQYRGLNGPYFLARCGGISYIDNGILHIYSYNINSELVDLVF